jgi:hypothetical protein
VNRSVPLWLVLILLLTAVSSGFAIAAVQPRQGRVVSGDDIGFRIEGVDRQGNPMGTLVIRMKGDWVPATSTFGVRPTN